MTTQLAKNQIVSGFKILEIADLEELNAQGVWAVHEKSGAEVFHIVNDDEENLFAFAFKTPPEDSTGAAHIVEHSVLCGSENYRLKDAFIVLARGSIQTFLNAMTYPDKTVYPASSTNRQDYFNLMSVYGDAVFRPLLARWTFMQEGHRLAPAGQGLGITGVVYNEMKGAYSSLENAAGNWSVRGVLPHTVYAHDSGGDPEEIPTLTWEKFRAFHKKYYCPANCRIFLAGNIPTEEQLAFLDGKFLAELPAGEAAGEIACEPPWKEAAALRIPCAAGGDQKATAFLSWRCGSSLDREESLALAALVEALLGHDGSPLGRALIESGLGEDLAPASGLDCDIREAVFTVGLRGVPPENEEKVAPFILQELGRLREQGIPGEEIEAALLSMEFSNREIRRSHGPYSLVWLNRSLRGWLHGAAPWETLLFVPPFAKIRQKAAEKGWFEGLIGRYLLDNPHRASIIITPEADFLEKQEARLAEKLDGMYRNFSKDDLKKLKKDNEDLEKIQGEGDSAEDLRAIPHLSAKDIVPPKEEIPRRLYDAAGVPVLGHSLFTNGITYFDFALPLDIFGPELYPWFPFFGRAAVSLGLPGMDYGEVASLLARTAGDFDASLENGSPAPGASLTAETPAGIFDIRGRDWLIYRLKALDEKVPAALDLALRIILETNFRDPARLRDLAAEYKNDADSSLAPGGSHYATLAAAAGFSRARKVDEIWNGLSQMEFAHSIAREKPEALGEKFTAMRNRLIAEGGLVVNVTAGEGALEKAVGFLEKRLGAFSPPPPRRQEGDFSGVQAKGPGVYASPSLRVGFAALALPGSLYGSPAQTAEIVLSHRLSTGPLWEEIRMQGGAYGASAYPDRMDRTYILSTYRDPDPLRSIEAFRGILKRAAAPSPEEAEKCVIGAFSSETKPRTGAQKGRIDFIRWLYGIEETVIHRRLADLLAVTGEDMAEAARRLASSLEEGASAVVCGPGEAEKAAAAMGAAVQTLPV